MIALLTRVLPWPYRWLALAVLTLAVWGWGWVKGAEHGEANLAAYRSQQQTAQAQAEVVRGQLTEQLRAKAQTIDEAKDEIIHNAATQLAADLVQLRQRPARHPAVPAASAACRGATGAELAAPDAEFLSRYAAAVAGLQADDDACHARYNATRNTLGGSP